MNVHTKWFFLLLCTFIGAFFCAYQNGWLIICLPITKQKQTTSYIAATISRKKVVATWWHDNSWQTESIEVVWSTDKNAALEALVRAWVALIDEENNETKPLVVQSAMFGLREKIAYISCDRSPFGKQMSMYDKLRWFDGLAKTILASELACTHIQLLVNHKPLFDAHLDFSKPWPVAGFIDSGK